MKKILSTILTLTMLALPLAVQCSARPLESSVSSNSDDVVIEFPDAGYIKPSKNSNAKGIKALKSLGKGVVVLGVSILGLVGLCKLSENGEAVYASKNIFRTLYNDYMSPLTTNAFLFIGKGISSFNNWLSKFALEKDKDGNPTKTLGQWVDAFVIKEKGKDGKEWHLSDVCNVIRNNLSAFFIDKEDLKKVLGAEGKCMEKCETPNSCDKSKKDKNGKCKEVCEVLKGTEQEYWDLINQTLSKKVSTINQDNEKGSNQ